MLQWLNCASDGECDAGDQTEDLRRLARWGMQQQEFWDNVDRLTHKCDCGSTFLAETVYAISAHATPDTFAAIPDYGWQTLALLFRMPRDTAAFFKASLHDFLFGGSEVMFVNRYAIPGARSWWEDVAFIMHIQWGFQFQHGEDAKLSLINKTYWVLVLDVAIGEDITKLQWSEEQKGYIREKYGISLPSDPYPSRIPPESMVPWP